ncbi:MAG: polysaccharide deacetylase family protein [Gemmatimonadaceae bacterium]
MYRRRIALLLSLVLPAACRAGNDRTSTSDSTSASGQIASAATPGAPTTSVPTTSSSAAEGMAAPPRAPNEMGRIPILEYHLVGDTEARWSRQRDQFRRDLELLYERGYRPVTVSDLVVKQLDLPAGLSPVAFTFDDASPSQFRYVERNGQLEIDPTSAIGIWLDFAKTHPGWATKATFCLLPSATHGHAFFGDKGIEGQKTEWRYPKLQWLAAQGFELCDHTLWHANLAKVSDAVVQEQIARGVMAIDSAVPGYRVRTLALPLGVWPKNRVLAQRGAWRDAKGRSTSYDFDAILEVSGTPVPSPHDPAFDPLSLDRIQVIGSALTQVLDRLEKSGTAYVSDGDPSRIARPRPDSVIAGRIARGTRATGPDTGAHVAAHGRLTQPPRGVLLKHD